MVEELCAEMALTRPEAFSEYVVFVVTHRGESREEARWAPAPTPPGRPTSDATAPREPTSARAPSPASVLLGVVVCACVWAAGSGKTGPRMPPSAPWGPLRGPCL